MAKTADDADSRKKVEAILDAGHGECWLRRDDVAIIVENALLHFDGERYRLLAWCVMPNHVHALIETFKGHPLGDVVQSWKSFTAKEINRCLGRTGTVWEEDYFDRSFAMIGTCEDAVAYIERQPGQSRTCRFEKNWPYG